MVAFRKFYYEATTTCCTDLAITVQYFNLAEINTVIHWHQQLVLLFLQTQR